MSAFANARGPERKSSRRERLYLCRSVLICGEELLAVSPQLGFKIRRNMRYNQGVVTIITQFEDMSHPVNLRYQRGFVYRNPKARAQSPRSERILQGLDKIVHTFSRPRRNRDASWKSFHVRL